MDCWGLIAVFELGGICKVFIPGAGSSWEMSAAHRSLVCSRENLYVTTINKPDGMVNRLAIFQRSRA